jgi:hypothetical protein
LEQPKDPMPPMQEPMQIGNQRSAVAQNFKKRIESLQHQMQTRINRYMPKKLRKM